MKCYPETAVAPKGPQPIDEKRLHDANHEKCSHRCFVPSTHLRGNQIKSVQNEVGKETNHSKPKALPEKRLQAACLTQWKVISGSLNLNWSCEYRFRTLEFRAEMVVDMVCIPCV